MLGLLQHGKGRVGLYGDSNCLDSSHSRSKCFKLLGHMIKWAAGEVRRPCSTANLCGWRARAAGTAARCFWLLIAAKSTGNLWGNRANPSTRPPILLSLLNIAAGCARLDARHRAADQTPWQL